MELRHLRYFVAIAEEGHFGRASKRLRIAQPPLSRQIHDLEAEIGTLLFDRSRRRVELTAGGDVFLAHVRRVFEQIDLGVRESRRAGLGVTGRITVGYPSSLAYAGLTELLRAFRQRSAHVEVAVREMPPQGQVVALKEGRIDLGFIRAPIDEPTLATELVRSEELVVALPAEHPFASRKRISLSLLARDPFISFPRARSPAFFDQLVRLCADAGFTPNIVQEAPQLDIVSLVAAGFGVAIVPASVRNIRRRGLVLRPIVGSPTTQLLVAWRPDDPSPVLRDFLEVVRSGGIKKRHRAT